MWAVYYFGAAQLLCVVLCGTATAHSLEKRAEAFNPDRPNLSTPRNFAVSNNTPEGTTLVWEDGEVPSVNGYLYIVCNVKSCKKEPRITCSDHRHTSERTLSVTGAPNEFYWIWLAAYRNGTSEMQYPVSDFTSACFQAPETGPEPAWTETDIMVLSNKSGDTTIVWKEPDIQAGSFDGYQYAICNVQSCEDKPSTKCGDHRKTSTTTLTVTAAPNEFYWMWIAPYKSVTESTSSRTETVIIGSYTGFCFQTPQPRPKPPAWKINNITVSSNKPEGTTLVWEEPRLDQNPFNGFLYVICNVESCENEPPIKCGDQRKISRHFLTVQGSPNEFYWVWIAPYTVFGQGSSPREILIIGNYTGFCFQTPPRQPAWKVKNITVSSNKPERTTLVWERPNLRGGSFDGFLYVICNVDSCEDQPSTKCGDQRQTLRPSLTVTGAPNESYWAWIAPYKTVRQRTSSLTQKVVIGNYTGFCFRTPPRRLMAPKNVRLTLSSPEEATVEWNPPTDGNDTLAGYVYTVCTVNSCTKKPSTSCGDRRKTSEHSIKLSTHPNKNYWVWLAAYNSDACTRKTFVGHYASICFGVPGVTSGDNDEEPYSLRKSRRHLTNFTVYAG